MTRAQEILKLVENDFMKARQAHAHAVIARGKGMKKAGRAMKRDIRKEKVRGFLGK